MALHFWQVKIRTAPARDQFLRVMEKVEAEIEETAGDRRAVHAKMLFDQVPPARPDEQDGDILLQPILFPIRVCKRDGAPDRVAEIDLALDQVGPRRRVRVLEVRHEHFRAGIERVDHHLAIGRAGNLDAAILQVWWDTRAGPIAVPDMFGFRQKIEGLTAIERSLPLLAPREALRASGASPPLQFCNEGERVW